MQVLYVTHSPFLIDKNHAERIRVLEKGEHTRRTRIVASVAQNHYEPLRSRIAASSAKPPSSNLQPIAGRPVRSDPSRGYFKLARAPKRASLERLDLNRITLVPAGGVGQVPYLIY